MDVSSAKAPARLALAEKEVIALEGILSRAYEANAVLVGDTEDEELAIVEALAKNVHDGKVSQALQHKRVFLLDALRIVEHIPTEQHLKLSSIEYFLKLCSRGTPF